MNLPADRCTGIPGLDSVLTDGIPLNRVLLVEGPPGSGKTTFALQFLREGVRHGGKALYITLSETESEIETFSSSHGWTLDGITVLRLLPEEYVKGEPQSFFHPSEVEMAAISKRIMSEIRQLRPARLAIDSLSEIQLFVPDTLRYHRQITAMKHLLTEVGTTAVLLHPRTRGVADPHLQTVVHGVIELDFTPRTYGAERRRLRVTKMREHRFVPGYHDYELVRGGLVVYPRIVHVDGGEAPSGPATITSGLPEVDALLGGIERGTSTLLIGTTGMGKSSFAAQYAIAAARRGERTHIYLFDESSGTYIRRSEGLGLPIRDMMRGGLIRLHELDPATLSPGEFADDVRRAVDADGARMVIVDSLSGYVTAMPEEAALMLQMHELLSYLHQRHVSTFLIVGQPGVFAANAQSGVDISYLADAVIVFRSFEAAGAVRKAISVIKKRYGAHEPTIREFMLEPGRIRVGPVLRTFEGVLTGNPHFTGRAPGADQLLMESAGDDTK